MTAEAVEGELLFLDADDACVRSFAPGSWLQVQRAGAAAGILTPAPVRDLSAPLRRDPVVVPDRDAA